MNESSPDFHQSSETPAGTSRMTVRVTHVATNHKPLDTRIFLKECVSLAKAGYEVSLVVPHTTPFMRDGVRVVPTEPPRNRRARFLRSGWQSLNAANRTAARIYQLHDPDLLPVGWILKLLGKTVVYDVHEDRPKQILSKPWIPRSLRPAVASITRVVETVSASLFDQVVAATPAIANTFPARKTTLVQNFPIIGELQESVPMPYDERANQVIFVGGMNAIRGVKQFVDAMALIPQSLSASLVLVGAFESVDFRTQVEASPGWRYTRDLGWQGRDSVAKLLGSSRIGLVTYLPEPNHLAAQPNKLFEYMSAGIPVIASDFPLWREIVNGADCGVLVDPADSKQVAEAITWLLSHPEEAAAMGIRGQEAVATRFNWGTQSAELLNLYDRLTT